MIYVDNISYQMIYNNDMISYEAYKKILGISEDVDITIDQMQKKIIIAFYPHKDKASKNVLRFESDFKSSLNDLNIQTLPFDDIWENVGVLKRIKRFSKYIINNIVCFIKTVLNINRSDVILPLSTIIKLAGKKKIKKNISIVCIGEQNPDDLVMQYISNFKTNSIITILDMPSSIDENTDFSDHFNQSMKLFAYHMTNIVICVNDKNWLIYNFNASHPIYSYPDKKLSEHIRNSLIPKLAAPISPHRLADFIIDEAEFDYKQTDISSAVIDMIEGSKMFSNTGLYPAGKSIDELPFRRAFHKHIGKLHLDNRNGMSFGYFAYQLPSKLEDIITLKEFRKIFPSAFDHNDYYVSDKGKIYVSLSVNNEQLVMPIPDAWVISLKSGSDKTNINPQKDLIKMGLINGKLMMQWPKNTKIDNTYKPSFDTKVILAHCVGNIMIAQVFKYFNKSGDFVNQVKEIGYSINHWHGYFNPELLMKNVYVYGSNNPHVSCSSPQSAIYALEGKLTCILGNIDIMSSYHGDIHVEPHHGINVSFYSLVELAKYIQNNPESTKLGNKYLY